LKSAPLYEEGAPALSFPADRLPAVLPFFSVFRTPFIGKILTEARKAARAFRLGAV
jgi:hypothetical protein